MILSFVLYEVIENSMVKIIILPWRSELIVLPS